MAVRAFITGLAGPEISANERAFLREAEPWGLIIFKRNIDTPAQVAALVRSFRDIVGREAPVLVDQEGGRVQRLGPAALAGLSARARVYSELYDRDPASGLAAARLGARLIASDLARARHRRRLPAAGRCAGAGQRHRHRRPGLWHGAGQGRGDRRRRRRGPARRRRAAGAQAPSGARPRHRRQPPQAAGGRYRPRNARKAPTSPPSGRWPACRSA